MRRPYIEHRFLLALTALFCTVATGLTPARSEAKQAVTVPQYTVTYLSVGAVAAEGITNIIAINNNGQILMSRPSRDHRNSTDTFRYDNGVLTNLGDLGGGSSLGTAMNEAGDIVGYSSITQGGDFHAFLYSGTPGKMKDLGAYAGGTISIAYSINNHGEVGGFSYSFAKGYAESSAFVWKDGVFTILDPLPAPYNAHVGGDAILINDAGQVAASSLQADGLHTHAFLRNRDGTKTDMGVLPAPYDDSATPLAINASGQVAGYGRGSGGEHGFLYANAKMVDIGTLEHGDWSRAYGINASGEVVGSATIVPRSQSYTNRAILYRNGTLYDLNDLIPANSGLVLQDARAINDKGQIVASAGLGWFLLTPTVHVDRVAMVKAHTLEVQVAATINPATVNKYLLIHFNLNGRDVLQSWAVPKEVTGRITHSFEIDLAEQGVPRFTDNQMFSVTADKYEDGIDVEETLDNNEIPLPLVHVHGILTDATSDRIPHGLFDALKAAHPAYQENTSFPNLGPDNGYPTLVSFDYHSMQDKVETAGLDLAFWIINQVKSHTYADRVNIVAHSKGGIIARSAIAYNGAGQSVNKLILVGSPCEGTPWASTAYAYFGSIKAVLTGVQLRYGPSLPSDLKGILNAMVSATPQSVLELCPTYGWWASSRSDVIAGRFQMPSSPANDTLSRLNAQALDTRVSYYAIASGTFFGATLNQLWGRYTNPVSLVSELTDDVAYDAGDGLVPLRSQLAQDLSWPRGQGPGKFHVYETVNNVFHTEYFDNPGVQTDIVSICWQ